MHKKVDTSGNHLKSFSNGTVDLRTGELFGHNKEDYLLSCSPCDYVAGCECPTEFKKFILSAYGGEQVEVIRAITSMYLDPTAPYGKFAYLIGDSGSGKGVLLRAWANLIGEENCVSSNSLTELTKPEGRHQLLTGKSLFYIPDAGGFLSGLKAFYELVDNGGISGRALFSSSAYQKKWNVRFAIASVEHIQTENSGDGWDRRCIPLQTRPRIANIEDPELGRKLSTELGEIAGWALSMDKTERDRILLVPSTNPSIVALKQDGAILGDSVRSFVDRCFRSGRDSYTGSDLHSWYAAYCKAHNLSPQGYNKFVHHLQRVLSNHWKASEVVREGDKIKRIQAQWRGLQILPCFVDVALAEDSDDSNRPHIQNWACIKTMCCDGGLQELTQTRMVTDLSGIADIPAHSKIAETLVVTDVTNNSEIVTTTKKAETLVVTDVTPLQDKSNASEKTSSPDMAENVNTKVEYQPVTDVTPVTTTVTPTFEAVAKSCNNSETCNNPIAADPPPNPKLSIGQQVKVSQSFPGRTQLRGKSAQVIKDLGEGLYQIKFEGAGVIVAGRGRVHTADILSRFLELADSMDALAKPAPTETTPTHRIAPSNEITPAPESSAQFQPELAPTTAEQVIETTPSDEIDVEAEIADMVGMIQIALSSDPEDVEGAVVIVNEIIKAVRNTVGISNSVIWERLTAQEQAAYRKALNSQCQPEA